VLCGGLSQSKYVQSRMKNFVEHELKDKVNVITPLRAWSAIARGAAVSACEEKIVEWRM
jgi:hypothetical protein